MTQFSMLPWTTGVSGDGAAPYTQEQANDFFRYFDLRDPASEGVALGVLSQLAVSGSSSPLTVAPGAAVCYGRYWNDTNVNLAVSTPTAGTTGGRVVLRCTWATRQIRLAVKTSPNGVGSIPTLTQVFGNTWEISLATFTITTGGVIALTDDRTFRKVTAAVDSSAMLPNSVGAASLQTDAVTTDKILDASVTLPKLAGTIKPWVLLGDVTLGSNGDITGLNLGSIPNTYTNLRLIAQWRLTFAGNTTISLRLNGDSGNNYAFVSEYVYQSGRVDSFVVAANNIQVARASGDLSNSMDSVIIDFPLYRASNHKSIYSSFTSRRDGAAANIAVGKYSGWWSSTSAISSIGWLTGTTVVAGSRVVLYGQ